MSTIGSIGQLVTAIRSELGKAATGTVRALPRQTSKTDASPYAERNMPALIRTRVRQIGRDDPQRGRKAFRVFLEVVLLSKLGEQMAGDRKFHQLLDEVQGAMESDAACAVLVNDAIAQLLSEQAGSGPR